MGARPGINRRQIAALGELGAVAHDDSVLSSACQRMLARLAAVGIRDEQVLAAMAAVRRELFIESAFRGRAYEDFALPIGYGQTISTPSIVARMIELAVAPIGLPDRRAARVLEIGTGCGYQAAVLAEVFGSVVSVERIESLHRLARTNLTQAKSGDIRLVHADGNLGVPGSAPFHAIVVAAAIDGPIPEPLLHLLRPGARLVAPVGGGDDQRLVVVDRVSLSDWHFFELDTVRFVPMLAGTE